MRDSKRIIILDEARGFFVICMVIYHFLYSYQFIFHLNGNKDIFSNDFMKYFQILISSSFIFISGISSSISKNILKRGIKLFGISILISISTYLLIPQEFIVFGILHFLGFSMITLGVLKWFFDGFFIKMNKNVNIMILLCLFLLIICYNVKDGYIGINGLYTLNLPEVFYKNIFTSILGFPNAEFRSADYFPIIPHIFLFYTGVFFAMLPIKSKLSVQAYKNHSKILNFAGKNSLVIYLFHQPIIFACIYFAGFLKNI